MNLCLQKVGLSDLDLPVPSYTTRRLKRRQVPGSGRLRAIVESSSIDLHYDYPSSDVARSWDRKLLNFLAKCPVIQLHCCDPPRNRMQKQAFDRDLLPLVRQANGIDIVIRTHDDSPELAHMIAALLHATGTSLDCFRLVIFSMQYRGVYELPQLPNLPNLKRMVCNAHDSSRPWKVSAFPADWLCKVADLRQLYLGGFRPASNVGTLRHRGASLRKLDIGSWCSEYATHLPNLKVMTVQLRPGCSFRLDGESPPPTMPGNLEALIFSVFEDEIDEPVLEGLPQWLEDARFCPSLVYIAIEFHQESRQWIDEHAPALQHLVEVCEEERDIALDITSKRGWPNYPEEPL